jgi:ABC-type multidrug transport system fused ATPase/permease subunit
VSDLLSSITGGIARFALAWLLPTSIAVGLFWGLCVPSLVEQDLVPTITGTTSDGSMRGPVQGLAIAAFIAFAISIILAYSSEFIYRLLEGYHLPRSIDLWMTARQRTRRERLRATVRLLDRTSSGSLSKEYGLAVEQLQLYPHDDAVVLPTRLGNALRALETYGVRIYSLDSQQFWYELIGTADDPVRREHEEARAQVDLFISAVAVFAGLAVAAALVVLIDPAAPGPLSLSALSILLVPLAYRGAIRNMKEWQSSVQALVNLGRFKVADGMGLTLPWRLRDERLMWETASEVLHYGDDEHFRPWLDVFRRGTPYVVEDGEPYGESISDLIAKKPASTTLRQRLWSLTRRCGHGPG